MLNTPRALDFIASLHFTILERPAGFRPAVSALTLELVQKQLSSCPKCGFQAGRNAPLEFFSVIIFHNFGIL
jgi:hypothetical protein